MAGGKSLFGLIPSMLLFLGACFTILGGLPGADAELRFNEHYINRGRGMHEVAAVKEYKYKQGFEATLRFVSNSGNKTFGADVNPLHLAVR